MSAPRERRKRDGSDGSGRLGPQRVRVALLVLTLFGAPLALMLSFLWMRNAASLPPYAAQPGGALAGRVTTADGAPAADSPVRVLLHPRDRKPEPFHIVRTDAEGAFTAQVPALDGCYVVVAGGETWVEESREVSLAEGAAPKLDFALQPGSAVVLSLARRDGRPIQGGEIQLVRAGTTFGLALPSAARLSAFSGARIELGGLRPGRWALDIHLDDGTEVTYELELEPGRQEIALEPF
jgi:hypothetical protein